MAKQANTVGNGDVAAASVLAGGADWRSLAVSVKAPEPVAEQLMGGANVGHNLVIDRRTPGAISVHIATDEQALAEIFQAKASDKKLKEDPNAKGARYLARTTGPMYGSVPLDIGGKRWYLKVSLSEDKG